MSEFSKRVIRNEPGVTEIHVEAREVLRDGPMRVECWWSEEDAAYIAQLTDGEPEGRPFTATHTGIGTTREEALAHLAVGEYVTALAVAEPRATPTPPEEAYPFVDVMAYRVHYTGLLPRPYRITKGDAEVFACALASQASAYLGKQDDGYHITDDVMRELLALARVPAEGVTGEPVAWCPRLADGRLQIEHASASLDEVQEDVRMLNVVPTASTDLPWQPVIVQPLYACATPPAAETGRRTETYPHDCGCETCPEHTPGPIEPDFEGDFDDVAVVGGAPADETGRTRITEAMVDAGVEAWLDAVNDRLEHEVSRADIVMDILRAALAARTGTP